MSPSPFQIMRDDNDRLRDKIATLEAENAALCETAGAMAQEMRQIETELFVIRDLATAERWTPVSEGLPTDSSAAYEVVAMLGWDNGSGWDPWGTEDVIAWRPAPGPWGGEE